MESLEARVERLEKGYRWARKSAAFLGIACLALVAAGQGRAVAPSYKASEYSLVDDEGKCRGGMSIIDGNAVFFLASSDNKTQVRASVVGEEVELGLASLASEKGISARIERKGSSICFTEHGKILVMMVAPSGKDGGVGFFRTTGEPLWISPHEQP